MGGHENRRTIIVRLRDGEHAGEIVKVNNVRGDPGRETKVGEFFTLVSGGKDRPSSDSKRRVAPKPTPPRPKPTPRQLQRKGSNSKSKPKQNQLKRKGSRSTVTVERLTRERTERLAIERARVRR